MNFEKQSAFVTGVSKGIGKAIALGLAKNHAEKIVICDINETGLNEVADLCREYGTEVLPIVLDVTDQDAVNEACKKAIEFAGKIDILINNAGIYCDMGFFADSKPEIWKKKIDVNIYGTLYVTYALINHMIDNQYGRIVNLGSVAGYYGLAKMADYSLTKGAVIAFTKALAKEVTGKGITVNCVSPGMIDVSPDLSKNNPNSNAMGRSGRPEECAEAILFLASREANYVSGQNLLVDGCRIRM